MAFASITMPAMSHVMPPMPDMPFMPARVADGITEDCAAAPTTGSKAARKRRGCNKDARKVKRTPRVGHSGQQRSGTSAPRASDWFCVECNNCNWETRVWCKRCGASRPKPMSCPSTLATARDEDSLIESFNLTGSCSGSSHPNMTFDDLQDTSSDAASDIHSDMGGDELSQLLCAVFDRLACE